MKFVVEKLTSQTFDKAVKKVDHDLKLTQGDIIIVEAG